MHDVHIESAALNSLKLSLNEPHGQLLKTKGYFISISEIAGNTSHGKDGEPKGLNSHQTENNEEKPSLSKNEGTVDIENKELVEGKKFQKNRK